MFANTAISWINTQPAAQVLAVCLAYGMLWLICELTKRGESWKPPRDEITK